MVLQDVAGGAGLLVEAGATADADVLGHRDLHGVDVVTVPDRLEQRVGEAQRQQVLDRLLAQVVVDAEDVPGGEDVVDQVVELLGRRQVVPERLLDDDPAPAARLAVVGHAGALHLLEHGREGGRRDRQVERRVALRAVRAVELAQRVGERVEGVVVVEAARQELDRLGEPRPGRLAELGARALLRGGAGERLEVAVTPVAAREAEQHEARRQQTTVREVVHRRDELLLGQVAGHAEDHQHARVGHPWEPAVARGAERVGVRGHG